MTERSGALQEDPLYMSYAEVMAKSCGEEEEEGGDEEEGEGPSIHVSQYITQYTQLTLLKNYPKVVSNLIFVCGAIKLNNFEIDIVTCSEEVAP